MPPRRPAEPPSLLGTLIEAGAQIFGQKAALDALVLALREPAVLETVARAIYDGPDTWEAIPDKQRALWRRRAHRGVQALYEVFRTGRAVSPAPSELRRGR